MRTKRSCLTRQSLSTSVSLGSALAVLASFSSPSMAVTQTRNLRLTLATTSTYYAHLIQSCLVSRGYMLIYSVAALESFCLLLSSTYLTQSLLLVHKRLNSDLCAYKGLKHGFLV